MSQSLAAQFRSDRIAMLTPHPETRRYIVSVWVETKFLVRSYIYTHPTTHKSQLVKRYKRGGYVAYIAPNDTLTQHRQRAASLSFDDAMSELIRRGRGGCVEPKDA